MTVLGCDKKEFIKKNNKFLLLTVGLIVTAIIINVLLTVFRTDATHIAFLVINIVVDVAAVWSAVAVEIAVITPRKRLLNLYERGIRRGVTRVGAVVGEPSIKTARIQGFDCRTVVLRVEQDVIELYLIDNGITLHSGISYELGVVENIIYSAEAAR